LGFVLHVGKICGHPYPPASGDVLERLGLPVPMIEGDYEEEDAPAQSAHNP
jgi:hypothetical protein